MVKNSKSSLQEVLEEYNGHKLRDKLDPLFLLGTRCSLEQLLLYFSPNLISIFVTIVYLCNALILLSLQAYFDAPDGNDPIAIDLETMSKGMAWVNGKSIGRYWVSFLSPSGKPSQSM